jgi:hypothetical protein
MLSFTVTALVLLLGLPAHADEAPTHDKLTQQQLSLVILNAELRSRGANSLRTLAIVTLHEKQNREHKGTDEV